MIKITAQVIGVNKTLELIKVETFIIAVAAEVAGGLIIELIKFLYSDYQ